MKDNRKDGNFWAFLRMVGKMHREEAQKKKLEEAMAKTARKPLKPKKPKVLKTRKPAKPLKPRKNAQVDLEAEPSGVEEP